MEIVHLEETENHFLFQNISGISVRSFLESFWISKKLIYKLEQSKALTVNAETVGFDFVLQSRDVIKISLKEFEKETLIPPKGRLPSSTKMRICYWSTNRRASSCIRTERENSPKTISLPIII